MKDNGLCFADSIFVRRVALGGGLLLLLIGGVGLALTKPNWLRNLTARKRPRLVSLPDLAASSKTVERQQNANVRLFIAAQPAEVYSVVRTLSNLQELIPCVYSMTNSDMANASLTIRHDELSKDVEVQVIADEVDEFLALRVEADGELQGTCLVKLENAPGNIGTIISLTTKFAPNASENFVAEVSPIALTQLHAFSENIKQRCELTPSMS